MILLQKQSAPSLIIDGDNLLHRAYWISKNKFITSTGKNTGVIYSGVRMLKSYADQFGAKNIYFAWDKRLVSDQPQINYRQRILQGSYKDTPTRQGDHTQIYEQEDLFRSVLTSLGVKHLHPRSLEADDVIAWLSQKIPGRIVVISNDGDLLQLVNDRVIVFNPIKKITIDPLNFKVIVGVDLKNYLDYRAISGDNSDNIKGVKGYGPKKAQKFVAHKDEAIKALTFDELQIFDRNLKLMDLTHGFQEHPDEIPTYEEQFNIMQNVKPNLKQFHQYCLELEFNTILKRFNEYVLAFERHEDMA